MGCIKYFHNTLLIEAPVSTGKNITNCKLFLQFSLDSNFLTLRKFCNVKKDDHLLLGLDYKLDLLKPNQTAKVSVESL